jgi:glutathione S-transferase
MALTLYVGSKRYSSWSLRPYLALSHTGAAFETRTILLDGPATAAEIAKVSPTGRVPVLFDGDLAIWDSLAICEHAAELFPAARLWPEERARRARARSLAAEMHAGFGAMRQAMPMELGARKPMREVSPEVAAEATADVRRVQAIWREALDASGGPFLFGAFTIADAMYAPVTTRFVTYGVEIEAASRAYVEAIAALPAMRQWSADAEREPRPPGA